jgi:superfamily II DNA/RNA helicase
LVINFDTPYDAEDYVHRVGRTARANTKGEAITLVNEKDMRKMAQIERLIEAEVPRLTIPESIGVSPEWKTTSGPKKNFNKKPFRKKFKKAE